MRTKLLFSKSVAVGAAALTTAGLLLAPAVFAQFGPGTGDTGSMGSMGPGGEGSFGPGGPGGMMGPGGQQGSMGPDSFGPGGQNDMIGPGGPGGFGPGGEGNMGPSDEQMEQMQKMQMKGMFKGIKQGMKGMSQGMKMMKSMLAKLAKQGISAPEELTAAITKAEEMTAYINSIKSADDIPDIEAFMDKMSEMAEVGPVMQEWGPRLGDLFKLGQMTKEAERRFKQISKDIKRAKAAAAKSKMDLAEQIAELDNAAATLQQALSDAKSKTDPDEKEEAVETFFEQADNVYDTIRLIDSLKNLGKAKANWTRQVKLNDADIKRLARRKLDVAELTAAQEELKGKLAELNSALSAKPIDSDAIVDALEDVKNVQGQFDDVRDELLGQQSDLPQVKTEKFSAPKMDFSAFSQFKKSAPAGEENGAEE